MRIQFHAHDKAPLDWGLEKIAKMAENVVKMSTFIRIESATAARHSAACERAKTFLATTAERPEGFSGEVEVADDVREVLYTSSLAWLRELNDKTAPAQTKMTLGDSVIKGTEKRREQVESLRDRLEGIIGIFDTLGTPPADAVDPDQVEADYEIVDADGEGWVGGKRVDGDDLWDQGPDAHRAVDVKPQLVRDGKSA